MRYTVLIDGEPGAIGVVFPDLPGCAAMGDTIDEAIDNAGEALEDWMATYTEDGAEPPRARTMAELAADPAVIEATRAGASFASVALVRPTGRPIPADASSAV